MTEMNRIGDPQVEVGEIWEFVGAFEDSQPDRYLVLQETKDSRWNNVFRVLHLGTGDIVPDLIIDWSSVETYNAHKVV